MPFCADRVVYPACIPQYKFIPPSLNWPTGRWGDHTVQTKDEWIAAKAWEHVDRMVGYEKNKTMAKSGKDINGHVGLVTQRFYKRPDCREAFFNLFCYMNFPRCDIVRDISLPTCRSACENFYRSCRYTRDLWRCGKTRWFNGYFPEAPSTGADGNITYLREYMPGISSLILSSIYSHIYTRLGQPFRENKYTTGGSEIPICTPAILGDGHKGYIYSTSVVLLGVALSALLIYV